MNVELEELPPTPTSFQLPPGVSIGDALALLQGIEPPAPTPPAPDPTPEAIVPKLAPPRTVELEELPEPPGPVLVALLAAELGVSTAKLLAALKGLTS